MRNVPITLLGLFGFKQQTVLSAESAISVKVDDEDASRVQSLMERSSVKVADRAAAYRKSGWARHDASAKPLTPEEVVRERSLYR